MKTRGIFTLSLSVLLIGGAVAGYGGQGFIAFAGTSDAAKMAAKQFDKARNSLAKGDANAAVGQAEAAVAYDPQMASYRVLLGQAYLKAGRFTSAGQAFGDAMSLEPGNGKAALHLALMQIAGGNWDSARRTLDANAGTIAVADRGLAIALAGDPAAAVELLSTAAHQPEADAKTRQNYALALALAGRWAESKAVVAIDVPADQVDARIMQWASFAKPVSAADQVATLLGVTPMQDGGQPVAIALNGGQGTGYAVAAPIEPQAPLAQAIDTASEPSVMAAAVSSQGFAPREEGTGAMPERQPAFVAFKRAPMSGTAMKPKARFAPAKPAMATGAAPARKLASGDFFVQLGAYENAAVAKDAWGRAKRANPRFAGHNPSGVAFSTKAGSFYRLSVGGFARGDADALCSSYRAKGGKCFVRAGAGDKAAGWGKIASR